MPDDIYEEYFKNFVTADGIVNFTKILAIETSCDDTSVAIVDCDYNVVSMVSANQDLFHRPFGGIVPEIAGRNHTLNILPLVDEVLKQGQLSLNEVDGFAVTNRPGLVGSLLVGLTVTKTLSLLTNKPFIGINHIEGHLLAPFLRDREYQASTANFFPCLGLVISGGHTSLYKLEYLGKYVLLGRTIDDAAGEAFDKFAKMLGFEYPGGIKIDQYAVNGNRQAFTLPKALAKEDSYNFSFSGLKTAGQKLIERFSPEQRQQFLPDICASFQEAVIETLLIKLNRAVDNLGLSRVIVSGGVSANSRLRLSMQDWAAKKGVTILIPPLRYCTDNAAMIGLAGIARLNRGEFSVQTLGVSPRLDLDEL